MSRWAATCSERPVHAREPFVYSCLDVGDLLGRQIAAVESRKSSAVCRVATVALVHASKDSGSRSW